jgi:thioredoxin 1
MRILLLALLAIGCSQAEPLAANPEAPASAPAAASEEAPAVASAGAGQAPEVAATGDRTLLFFLNPNGRPCKTQQAILDEMGASLTDKVTVKNVSVLEQASRPMLYQYGIRALPNLIVVDGAGKELHRFTPGIQSADAIAKALE